VIHLQNIKKNCQNRFGEHFSASSEQMGFKQWKHFDSRSEDLPSMLALATRLADDATTSTLSSTESEAESPTHPTMDAALRNTSFELCSVSPLKRHR